MSLPIARYYGPQRLIKCASEARRGFACGAVLRSIPIPGIVNQAGVQQFSRIDLQRQR